MKKILMTWYGITDLRASLGLEYSNGPILSALLAEEYTDVLILGYTNNEKPKIDESIFEKDLIEAKNNFEANNQSEVWNFINKYSNTEIGHNHFIKWLKSQLEESKKSTEIIFRPIELAHLNDTEGIYDVATRALDLVANFNAKKEVSFYLSPGTPVMAFVWAFVALRHPSLKKKLIASPVANKLPEEVSLPEEWIEWHGRSLHDKTQDSKEYDIVFHLFGEQRMPSLLGILQFSSKKHIFINSKQYPAQIMKQFIGNAKFDEIPVNPFEPSDTKDKILSYLEELPLNLKIGFNLTGGTKLMYAGALAACKKINGTPFYFDGRNNKVIYLDDFKQESTKRIDNVETFIKLHGNDLHISKSGYWNDIVDIDLPKRKDLTDFLWKKRSRIAKVYRDVVPYNDDNRPFNVNKSGVVIKYDRNKKVEISIDGDSFSFEKWDKFATYITGGWFEEYMYMQFEAYMKEGKIFDLRIGLEISFKDAKKNQNISGFGGLRNMMGDTYQELDIVFTDGKRLYIIECKAGNVKSEFVMKLQNIVRYFGGMEGKGILAACFPPSSKIVQKKIDESYNMEIISGQNLKSDLEFLFS
jgi:hypothetical protein